MQSASAGVVLSMKLNLYISARKLKDLDITSKSDPCAALFEFSNGKWVKLGQTETIKDQLNPDFEKALEVAYHFEKLQKLKFVLIDDDGSGSYDTIGEVETSMAALMGAKAQTFSAPLVYKGNANRGTVIVRAEAVQESNANAEFSFTWQNLNNFSSGFIGIGKKRKGVRFEIGRQIPGTEKFAEIFASRNIKQ